MNADEIAVIMDTNEQVIEAALTKLQFAIFDSCTQTEYAALRSILMDRYAAYIEFLGKNGLADKKASVELSRNLEMDTYPETLEDYYRLGPSKQ